MKDSSTGMRKTGMMAEVSRWFESEQGRYVLDWEQRQYDNAVDDIFGFHAVQVGLPGVDFLRENRIPLKLRAGGEEGCTLAAAPEHLPLASHCVDLLVLPHVLEFSEHPHQILREAERVLIPEGQIVISGFNPLSLWGAKRRLGATLRRKGRDYPWNSRFIGLPRLKDWLALLGFEFNGGQFGCYAPPFVQARWLERFDFMERAGSRGWPIAGGTYVIRAIKRNHGMRLVTPPWREPRVKRPALVQVARRNNVIHVRPIQRR
jgi:SAM-dependent methyltransferase